MHPDHLASWHGFAVAVACHGSFGSYERCNSCCSRAIESDAGVAIRVKLEGAVIVC